MKNTNSTRVYSTAVGRLCSVCQQPQHSGACVLAEQVLGDGKVRIRLDTKGRKGMGVTTISGIPLTLSELKTLHGQLKKKCGVGGAVKDGVLELQGDQRQLLLGLLADKGWDVKLAGG